MLTSGVDDPRYWPALRSLLRPAHSDDSAHRRGESAQLLLWVSSELAWFDGHFPGQPLLPAVIQTHWAVTYARRYLSIAHEFRSLNNLKFSRFILPDSELELHLGYDRGRHELQFEFRQGQLGCASGRVRFAA